jgi:thiol-disulfide isomerase/thioredoxin
MTSIVLFYATWCGHCNEFRPTWEIIKQWCQSHNVVAKEYESKEVDVMTTQPSQNTSGVPMNMIDGFPAIFIVKNGNIEHVDKRDKDYILRLLGGGVPLQSERPIIQNGGGSDFKMKYLKYKKKYLSAKGK